MTKTEDLENKFKNPTKPSAAVKLMGGNEENDVVNETAATNEEPKNNEEIDDIATAYADSVPKKREKHLKGIYIDSDVLEKYNQLSDKMPRGWGSQLVSDLLRKEFIKQGIKLDPK